jgi:putative PIG3 family NAD(P)H quinone oxidoreductase
VALLRAVDVKREHSVDVPVPQRFDEMVDRGASRVFALASKRDEGQQDGKRAFHQSVVKSAEGGVGSHREVRLANRSLRLPGATMHAIQVLDDEHRSMVWSEVPDPTPRPDEVVVAVRATAVNRADLLQRRGLYPPPEGASEIIGLEAAGVVEEIGAEVDPQWKGRRVAALLAGGGYARRVAVPAAHLLVLPDTMTFERAAAIPEVFYTAYLNLFGEAGLQSGESVMIHAAASGVGTAALQLCREHGCRAIATASGAKLHHLPELGASVCVDRHEDDFVQVAATETAGQGVDVILDPVGADYLERNIDSLAVGGRMVVIGLLGGTSSTLNLARLLRRRLRVIGSVLRARSNAEKADITKGFVNDVWPWFEQGRVHPVIDRVMSIEDVTDAHALLRKNRTVGKVVLTIPL